MRKLVFIAVCTVPQALIPQTAHGQDFALGGGIVYGSEIEQPGVQVNGYLSNPGGIDWLRVGGDFTYYLRDRETAPGATFTRNVWELNANGHFLFVDNPDYTAYVIGGLNLTSVRGRVRITGVGSSSASDSEIGLNAGVGGEMRVAFGNLYGELKYVISDFDQFVVGVGVRFPFGR